MLFYRIVVFSLFLACSVANSVEISGVSVKSKIFDIEGDRQYPISFNVSSPSQVDIEIYDNRDLLIRRISQEIGKASSKTVYWDGKDEAGVLVPSDAYHYVIRAKTDDSKAVYDVTDTTGGERIALKNFKWNAVEKSISFYLLKPSRVVIRAGLNNRGPLLKTIVSWEAYPFGFNKLKWNGQDESKVMDLSTNPNLELARDAFTLPENHILVRSDTRVSSVNPTEEDRLVNISWEKTTRKSISNVGKTVRSNISAVQSIGDFPLDLEVMGGLAKNSNGAIDVSGSIRIRLDLDEEYSNLLVSQRFEPVFYVNGEFIYENEVGFFPMTFEWDSSKYNEGVHYLTANLRGDKSNFGMATLKLNVIKK